MKMLLKIITFILAFTFQFLCLNQILSSSVNAQGMAQTAAGAAQNAAAAAAQAVNGSSGCTGNGPCTNIADSAEALGFFDTEKNLGVYINVVIQFLFVMAALATLLYLIWGAMEWLSSGGEQQKYQNARNKITAAIIGLALVALSFVIWQLLLYVFGFQNLEQLNAPVWNEGAGATSGSAADRVRAASQGASIGAPPLNGGGTLLNQGGGGSGTGGSTNNDWWPFESEAHWRSEFAARHGGRQPNDQDLFDFGQSQPVARDQQISLTDWHWENYSQTGNFFDDSWR